MRALITGGRGRLARALRERLEASGASVCGSGADSGRYQPDVTELAAFREFARREAPTILLHCAAWTDVDGCARQPERADLVNALGTRNAATVAAERDIPIVYVSSNEVFAGKIGDAPFHEYDRAQPANPMAAANGWVRKHCARSGRVIILCGQPGSTRAVGAILCRACWRRRGRGSPCAS